MNVPYIGVTDFINRAQVEQAKAVISSKRRLHVGAMTSFKVENQVPTKTGWEKIWLNSEQLHALFVDDPHVYNVIHYADYEHTEFQHAPTDIRDLTNAVIKCGPSVDAIQLDMVWPQVELVREFNQTIPIDVILQVSSQAVKEIPAHVGTIERAIEPYLGCVDYYLIDGGMGRGTAMDLTSTLAQVEILLSVGVREDQIAVAGGLGPETYENLRPLLDRYPRLSCDAQGRLRPSHSAVDPLDMDLVTKYVAGVSSLIR